jgi:hypothetical protein
MNHRTILYALLILGSYRLFCPQIAFTENNTLKESLAEAGISENSRFYSLYTEKKEYNGETEYEPPLLKETENVPQEIIQHLRSTTGVEFKFEKTEPKMSPPFRRPEINKEILAASEKDFVLRNIPGGDPLPDCTEDKTETGTGESVKKEEEESSLLDMLFIRKSQVPLDPEVTLGEDVEIYPYDETDESSVENVSIKGARIPCLPYRIRVVGDKVLRDMGKNALLFYGEKKGS